MRIDRRHLLAILGGTFAGPAFGQSMSRITAYAFSFAGLEGGDIKLADYAGKPILIVNTASLCGYTPQYAGLQELWTRYHPRGPDDRRRAVERFRRPGAGHGRPTSSTPRTASTASAFRSPPRSRSKEPTHIRSTNGRRPSGHSKPRAGISTSTWSAATVTSRRRFRPGVEPMDARRHQRGCQGALARTE